MSIEREMKILKERETKRKRSKRRKKEPSGHRRRTEPQPQPPTPTADLRELPGAGDGSLGHGRSGLREGDAVAGLDVEVVAAVVLLDALVLQDGRLLLRAVLAAVLRGGGGHGQDEGEDHLARHLGLGEGRCRAIISVIVIINLSPGITRITSLGSPGKRKGVFLRFPGNFCDLVFPVLIIDLFFSVDKEYIYIIILLYRYQLFSSFFF